MNNAELLTTRLAMILEVVTRLEDTGKTNLQKIVYFLQEAVGVPLMYPFRMHHYGPYSDDLDGNLSLANALGYVDIKSDAAGYGYHLTPIQQGEETLWSLELEPFRQAVEQAVDVLGGVETWRLELYATVHFVGKLDAGLSREQVLNTVRSLKPKFTIEQIDAAYHDLQKSGLISE